MSRIPWKGPIYPLTEHATEVGYEIELEVEMGPPRAEGLIPRRLLSQVEMGMTKDGHITLKGPADVLDEITKILLAEGATQDD